MSLDIRIHRLVLEGLPITVAQARLVQAAVESELARLLERRGLPPVSHAEPRLPVGEISIAPTASADEIGIQVGQQVWATLSMSTGDAGASKTKEVPMHSTSFSVSPPDKKSVHKKA